MDDYLTNLIDIDDISIVFDNIIPITQLKNKIKLIVDWLKSPIRVEKVQLSNLSFEDAYNMASTWHDELKATGVILNETGTVLMVFDDGYYWIDLETTSSKDEADAMGHCGTTSYGDTLLSLRKNNSPHVTVAIGMAVDYVDYHNTIYQMKGRNNKKPIEKYHKYILELLSYPNVSDNVKIINDFDQITKFSTSEYKPSEDFHISDFSDEKIMILMDRNPDVVDGIGVNYKLYKKGLISGQDFVRNYVDLQYIDGKIHFIVNDWMSFSNAIEEDNKWRKGWYKEYITGEKTIFYDTIEFDYTYNWDIKPSTLETIMDWLKKSNISIEYGDEEIKISDNIHLSPNKDDIWIKSDTEVLSLKNLLNKQSDDGLDELRSFLNNAYTSSQELADESEGFDAIINAICQKVGNPLKKNNSVWFYNDNGEYSLHFDFDNCVDWISKLEESSTEEYDDIIFYVDTIEDEDLLIKINVPYNGWNGSIDKETLNDEIVNQLN